MEYNKLVAVKTVYVSSSWVEVDTHGLLCKMYFPETENTICIIPMDEKGNYLGESVFYPGETFEFIGKMKMKLYIGSGGCNVRFILYDKG